MQTVARSARRDHGDFKFDAARTFDKAETQLGGASAIAEDNLGVTVVDTALVVHSEPGSFRAEGCAVATEKEEVPLGVRIS